MALECTCFILIPLFFACGNAIIEIAYVPMHFTGLQYQTISTTSGKQLYPAVTKIHWSAKYTHSKQQLRSNAADTKYGKICPSKRCAIRYASTLDVAKRTLKKCIGEEAYLMVINSESGADFIKEWNSQSEYNDPNREKHEWNITDIYKEGNYKSYKVNEWDSANYPIKATLTAYNRQGDALMEVWFNTTGCGYNTECWMTKQRILESTFEFSSLYIDYLDNTSELMMSDTPDHSSVWFSTWNSTGLITSLEYPLFLFSIDTTKSYPLVTVKTTQQSGSGVSFTGCYVAADVTKVFKEFSGSMTLAMCEAHCTSDAVMILQTQNICNCGTIVNAGNVYADNFCDDPCLGDPASTYCGTGLFFAVYNMAGEPVTITTTTPMFSNTLGRITLTHNPKPGTNQIRVNVSEYLGDIDNPGHINSVIVNYGVPRFYKIHYSIDHCSENNRKVFVEGHSTTLFVTGGMTRDTGLLLLRCLWFVFVESFTGSTPVTTILQYQNETKFYSAPILAVSGYWEREVTTTETMSTTQDIITSAFVSTAVVTTTETMTTADDGTTSAFVSTADTTEPVIPTTDTPTETTTEDPGTSSVTSTEPEVSTTDSPTTSNDHITSAISSDTSTDNSINTTPNPTTSTEALKNENNVTCMCTCSTGTLLNLTETQLKVILRNLKTNLLLNKTKLSSYIRTKISAKDDRPSAQGIGYSGAVLMAFVMGFPIVMDLSKVYETFQKKQQKAKSNNKKKDKKSV